MDQDFEEQRLQAELMLEDERLARVRRRTADRRGTAETVAHGAAGGPHGTQKQQKGAAPALASSMELLPFSAKQPHHRIDSDTHYWHADAPDHGRDADALRHSDSNLHHHIAVAAAASAAAAEHGDDDVDAAEHDQSGRGAPAGPPLLSLVKEVVTATGMGISDALGLSTPQGRALAAGKKTTWRTRCVGMASSAPVNHPCERSGSSAGVLRGGAAAVRWSCSGLEGLPGDHGQDAHCRLPARAATAAPLAGATKRPWRALPS